MIPLGHSTGNLAQPLPVKNNTIQLLPSDRILVLAPHPDDEVLGAGGIIARAKKMNLPIKVVFLTYGDNNEWSFLLYRKHPVVLPKAVQNMGLIRHAEALAATKILGLSPEQLTFLGYPDSRTLNIWNNHWGVSRAVKSMLTEVRAVPYENAFRPRAPYKGEEVLKDLKAIIHEFKPTKIFVSHPADRNPDHRALYLFARIALWDLEDEIKPTVYPYLIHYRRWPLPRGYHPEQLILSPDIFKQEINWQTVHLSVEEVDQKYTAIKKHRSQYISSAKYLLTFIRSNELFGNFPVIRLNQNGSTHVVASPMGQEHASFVGLEERSVSIEDNNLVITINLSRRVGKTVGVSLYVFGYRKDRDFAQMPKVHIRLGALGYKVFDQNKKLPLESVKVKRDPKEITIKIPLRLIGNPQRILTNAQTYLGKVPLDWVSWRELELSF